MDKQSDPAHLRKLVAERVRSARNSGE